MITLRITQVTAIERHKVCEIVGSNFRTFPTDCKAEVTDRLIQVTAKAGFTVPLMSAC